jgi:NDP-sugar pyrophosphorylase family protein
VTHSPNSLRGTAGDSPSPSLTAFFLCAGYGSRLRPLTDRVPKPGIPFLGQSALAINVRAADALKPDRRIANAHHLPDTIRAIAEPLGLDVIFEPEILGTGGCLANAAPFLRKTDHVLVHNADLIHAIDLAALYRDHLASGALATLAALNVAHGVNTLSVSDAGELLGVHGFDGFAGDAGEAKRLTFAGIAFYRREFLDLVDTGPEDIKPYWIRALKKTQDKTEAPELRASESRRSEGDVPVVRRPMADALSRSPQPGEGGGRIRVADVSGTPWFDFGTPQGLWDALKYRMESTGTFAHNYPTEDRARPFVSNESGTELPAGLRNVAAYETPRIPLEAGTTNLLTGFDFDWKVRP